MTTNKIDMQLISVIIPVFNMEDSLDDTIKSVVEQTYSNLDIVCVDDGSTDGSLEKLKIWAARDNRIQIITRKNGGLSAARNSGIDSAKGDYIVFVDAGDVLFNKAVQILLEALIFADVDVAVSKNFVKAVSVSVAHERLTTECNKKISFSLFSKPLDDLLKYKYVMSSVCNKLYRREVVGKQRFQEGVFFEDWPFVTKIFGDIDSFVLVDRPLYGYILQEGSITRSDFSEKKLLGYVYGIENLYDHFSRKGIVPRAVQKRCAIAVKMMLGKVWHACAIDPALQKRSIYELFRLVRERKVLLRDIPLKTMLRVLVMYFH
jgi:glycosyltransferase involved in cell wall biosynthesis